MANRSMKVALQRLRNRSQGPRPIAGRSSLMIWPVVIALLGVGGILTGFQRWWLLSAVLSLLFLVTLFSRLWAGVAGKRLDIHLSQVQGRSGMFPGEQLEFTLQLHNRKLLPVLWASLFMPLPETLCVSGEHIRPVEDWEKPGLMEKGCSAEQAGEIRLPAVWFYGSTSVRFFLTAKHRGLWTTRPWALETGDGLGLCQVELGLPKEQTARYAVYPRLQPVRTERFYHTSWDADTGDRGVLEDVTLIRNTRDYQVGDSVKNINWRQMARGQGMTVNLYEQIMPRSVFFILDGESFSGPEKHMEELEETLSILASLLVTLTEEGLQCGLAVSEGKRSSGVSISCGESSREGAESLLWQLAAYQPKEDVRQGDSNTVIQQKPLFPTERLLEAAEDSGRCYYIAFGEKTLTQSESLLKQLSPEQTELLLWEETQSWGDFRAVGIRTLKGDGA